MNDLDRFVRKMNDNHLLIDTALAGKINKKVCIDIIKNVYCQRTCISITIEAMHFS